ncbi:ABC transporter permease [Alkalimarinus sediminis]|uniref:Arginine ABC transporter permease protein ArtM n=1 Tax=Alkalimarinus sediminis TaxID=1632866 RepID=A0A9E8HH31_9ALTE|nr:ABC transporter permease [Alkalimarinus sediminis]UZW74072.1 ABC transporter permease [Alkalimarinus sediminis]
MLEQLNQLLAQNEIFTPATLAHYWGGFVVTVQLVFLALIIGAIIALPLGILRTSKNPWISKPIWLYVYVFRGTPLIVQLFLIYYGTAQITAIKDTWLWDNVLSEAFYPCLIAFVLNTAAYTTEIIKGAIDNTPAGEIEAAKAYGMSWTQRMRRIILPSAFRRALPAYANEVIFMLHASAIASVVTIVDLTGAARDIYSRHYAPFDAFLFVAAIYLCITFALIFGFRYLENKLLAHLKPLS